MLLVFLSLFFLFIVINMEDLKIMEKCISWDLSYFWKIYDKYIDKIYRFVYLKTTNKEVAEDIVSDVFMSAINNINNFSLNSKSSVSSWLYRIANNKVIDYYRTNKQESDICDYLDYSTSNDINQDIDNKNKIKDVISFLNTFKKEQRDIVIYKIWYDMSYSEISELTWKSVDNCKKIVSRILQNISANFVFILLLIILF